MTDTLAEGPKNSEAPGIPPGVPRWEPKGTQRVCARDKHASIEHCGPVSDASKPDLAQSHRHNERDRNHSEIDSQATLMRASALLYRRPLSCGFHTPLKAGMSPISAGSNESNYRAKNVRITASSY